MSIEIRPYHAIEDLYIDREANPQWAILRHGEDDEHLFTFSADMTDKQITEALRFAAQAYMQGQKVGSEARAAQIRAALGVPAITYADA